VNNLQEGLQAIRLLDENKKGKANFFLLDKFSDSPLDVAKPEHTISAMDVIEVDSRYRNLAAHLLGHVFIAENEEALSISGTGLFAKSWLICEKSGKYVKGKYSLTGGSVGIFEGKKIGRVKNLEKLESDIRLQEEVVNALKQDIQYKHNEVIAFNDQLKEKAIREAQEDINKLGQLLYSLENKMETLNSAQEVARHRLQESQIILEETIAGSEDTRKEWQEWVTRLNGIREQLQAAEVVYRSVEEDYNGAQANYNECNLALTRQQSKITALEQELEFKSNQLRDLAEQVTLNTSQLEQTLQALAESREGISHLEEERIVLLQRKEEEELKLNEADSFYYVFRNAMGEKENELRSKVKQKESIDQLLSSIKDRLNELKLHLAGMKERLYVEFRIDLETILEEARTTETPTEELQEKCDRMKKRLENIGEVNPTAIEAFQEMKKRYEFILEQKNDLVTAKESLIKTIEEVENTANQQFLDTFTKVRENFQKVFKALFTDDDTADLILENPENLAETSIDIMAKPKGKRPSSITQLSGGEKTLTATALLFAIYLIKPAPFCILDEVDAPLDDANVSKFTNMIRKFSEQSQFIIVTHNKMTMNSVDVIYGVTMQEPGVSKLVPVDFRALN
jgi:chromosome segregation protein